jgi:4-hydroxy-3-methylbut-2-enyl diphosphate reductase
VSKVHFELQRHFDTGREIVLIGHAGHPEVVGAMGQLPPGSVTLIETVEDAKAYMPSDPANVAFATQTTLSVDDTSAIVEVLKGRFPEIAAPRKDDICYATTNRQEAVKQLAAGCELVLVIGSPNSSNSLRLVEVALRGGAKAARLIDDVSQLDLAWLEGVSTLGLTAGASAPEELVQDLIAALSARFDITLSDVAPVRETVTFKLPRALSAQSA